ncbi:MAG TPA: hypothetical protein VIQ74_16905 [Gemmatimonadaceae bacterium]|jgi:hypothetical protein
MAQLRIEQKRGGLGWLWLIIALVLAAIIAWFIAVGGRETTPTPANTDTTTPSSLGTPPPGAARTLPAAA